MDLSEIELPSNRKFGLFFTIVFLALSIFLYIIEFTSSSYILITLSGIFLSITLIKADLLLPLNKLWMRFGLLLSMIVSPIVLGLIFFVLVTPYGIVMRLFGRDELHLKKERLETYWINRSDNLPQTNYKQQF